MTFVRHNHVWKIRNNSSLVFSIEQEFLSSSIQYLQQKKTAAENETIMHSNVGFRYIYIRLLCEKFKTYKGFFSQNCPTSSISTLPRCSSPDKSFNLDLSACVQCSPPSLSLSPKLVYKHDNIRYLTGSPGTNTYNQ